MPENIVLESLYVFSVSKDDEGSERKSVLVDTSHFSVFRHRFTLPVCCLTFRALTYAFK